MNKSLFNKFSISLNLYWVKSIIGIFVFSFLISSISEVGELGISTPFIILAKIFFSFSFNFFIFCFSNTFICSSVLMKNFFNSTISFSLKLPKFNLSTSISTFFSIKVFTVVCPWIISFSKHFLSDGFILE